MFEKSLAGTNGGRRPLSFLISLGSQAVVIGAAVALSIASAPALPMAEWTRVMLTPPSPPPAPPPPPSVQATPVRTTAVFDPLRAPTKMPDRAAILVDAPADRPALTPHDYSGVVGGDPAGVPGGVLNSIGTPRIEPPPTPEPRAEPKREPPTGPVRVSSQIQAARLIRRIEPTYPRLAVQARVEGAVKLHAVISREGSIEKLRVLSGHPLLVSSAVQAVKQWRYRPTLLGEIAVPVETQVDVVFKLR